MKRLACKSNSPKAKSNPEGTRTPDKGIMSHSVNPLNLGEDNDSQSSAAQTTAHRMPIEESDAQLSELLCVWGELPKGIRDGIMKIIASSLMSIDLNATITKH